jgi:GNAT superfamily N-acetyltransferase
VPRYGDFQVLFIDQRTDRIIARGRTIPFRWDGTLADLPGGIDALGLRALGEDGAPTALSALAAEVDDDYQGSGLSRLVILTMAALARAHGLRSLVAPVRPNWKDRYPLISIDRYAAWTRPDGLPFDPWMRVHARLS